MEDILYKNSVSDIRIREMVTKTGNNDLSLSSLKKITLRSSKGEEEDTIILPLNNQNYLCDFDVAFIELQFDNINFWLIGESCPLVIKQDNIYKSYEINNDNNNLKLLYVEMEDQNSEPNEKLIVSIRNTNSQFNPPVINPVNPGTSA